MKKLKVIGLVLTVAILFLASADNTLANIGGPDSAGYGWMDSKAPVPSVQYNWTDISTTGTNTGIHCDDCTTGAVPIGFNFSFYGNTYSNLYITSNGILSFSGGTTVWANYEIASGSTPSNSIYVLWDDLYSTSPGNIYYRTIGEAPNRIFIV